MENNSRLTDQELDGKQKVATETWLEMKRRHIQERNNLIADAIKRADGNQAEAARAICMDRGAMLRLMRIYDLK